MSTSRCWSVTWLVAFTLLLTACASPAPRGVTSSPERAYETRLARMESWETWGFSGRLGMDDGRDGGSGRLDWLTEGEAARLQFRGALGQGAWQLDVDAAQASLELSDGSIRQAPNVDMLVMQEIGWVLPVAALSWWVRGLAWPGDGGPQALQLNDDGTPAELEQLGWRVSYQRYADHAGERLPSRLQARNGDRQVKLAVSRWHGGTP